MKDTPLIIHPIRGHLLSVLIVLSIYLRINILAKHAVLVKLSILKNLNRNIGDQRFALLLHNAMVQIKSTCPLMQRAVENAKLVQKIKCQTKRRLHVLIELHAKTAQHVCHRMSTAANHALLVKLQVLLTQKNALLLQNAKVKILFNSPLMQRAAELAYHARALVRKIRFRLQ